MCVKGDKITIDMASERLDSKDCRKINKRFRALFDNINYNYFKRCDISPLLKAGMKVSFQKPKSNYTRTCAKRFRRKWGDNN